ncbi:hypothetical protein TanjilG_24653 [Lupinus angustifolius]|uniref:Pectinesterase inhibitor domain-containing protein n=1 Tax=Lupinus angustifolius TaxID=3871 RepID=A0A4P1RK70_LUPAN|nr:PREDICTED: 21 kDa protein-like [Lupinus angustifolius]OIW12720.1 hypothetical protein TanjilG_24653 [Lupinus angustifolius]
MIIIFFLFIFISFLTNTSQLVFSKEQYNVSEVCKVTRYPNLCIHSLAPFSLSEGRSLSKWARVGVSVTISEVKSVQSYLARLKRQGHFKGRKKVALSDCIETFQYALDELHSSLNVLRRLSKSTFGTQMGDLNTWLSAALTDEDTCLDGFEDNKEKKIKLLRNQVLKAYYITSNALALVNKLATTGLDP